MTDYRLPTLNEYYHERLDLLILDSGNTDYFSTSQIKKIRPVYNRLRRNPVWHKIAERGNPWELVDLARHIVNGEIIANQDTFLWYLLDRYEDFRQITIYQAAEDEDCIRWRIQGLGYWLNGLSVKYPDLIHFTNTHGLGSITFQRMYNN